MSHPTLAFTKFRVWQVVVPGREDIVSAPPPEGTLYRDNLSWSQIPIHLVEGITTEGFTAVGECERGASEEAVTATLRELVGRNLLDLSPATVWMQPREANGLPMSYPSWSWQSAGGRSYWILETLWFDAVGKAVGLPAHRLMGGAVRDVVAADFWANRPPAHTLAALVAEAIDRGLRGLKMKCDSTGDMVRSLVAIANDVPPDFRFTIDPMYAWRSLRESARYFEQLARLEFPIQIEDPFPLNVEDDWRRARQIGPMTIVCHPRRADLFRHALREELADAYNLGGGSCLEFLQTSQVAEFFSKDCWQGSSIEMGVLQALRLHAAACARNCVLASDLCSEWVREHTLVTPRMEYRDAGAVVPNRPGLGVALDHAAVEKYTVKTFEIG
ncbi:MAG TPA: mandelate racemase/muconate lactonizing enzyme family protein [Caldilineaceae bacterium]|nr:mandelate racemase/muconate lactonizing enzyme family protein [Caldilineaceae bacterium]